MTKEEVYKQKTQKHMEDVGCVSSGLKKKHKNTQNTKGVTLFICPFEAKKNTKTRKIHIGCLPWDLWWKTQKHIKHIGWVPRSELGSYQTLFKKNTKTHGTHEWCDLTLLWKNTKTHKTYWVVVPVSSRIKLNVGKNTKTHKTHWSFYLRPVRKNTKIQKTH